MRELPTKECLCPYLLAEMGAIGGALSASAAQPGHCVLALGSNKSCYGHTEGAAGKGRLLGTAGLLPYKLAHHL